MAAVPPKHPRLSNGGPFIAHPREDTADLSEEPLTASEGHSREVTRADSTVLTTSDGTTTPHLEDQPREAEAHTKSLQLRNKVAPTPIPAEKRNRHTPQTPNESDYPGGRLQLFATEWSDAPTAIYRTAKRGFHWTWLDKPPALSTPKKKPQPLNPDLSLAIRELLYKQAIYKANHQPCFLSNVFLVPKKSGGFRFIINLSRLNKFIYAPRFHMSNHTSLASMLQPPVWTTSIDLQDAYFHIPIRPSLHKFLAFMHEEHLFFFKALPFELNVAPYIFTRLLRYPLGVLHQSGIPVIAYIDD